MECQVHLLQSYRERLDTTGYCPQMCCMFSLAVSPTVFGCSPTFREVARMFKKNVSSRKISRCGALGLRMQRIETLPFLLPTAYKQLIAKLKRTWLRLIIMQVIRHICEGVLYLFHSGEKIGCLLA